MRFCLSHRAAVFVLILCCGAARIASADEPASAEQIKFFELKVRPVLATNCVTCHGPKKQRGQLRLDSLAGMLKGGETGPAITLGKPDESLLVEAINHTSLEMPPDDKLEDGEIAALTEWIRAGAPWPSDSRYIIPVVDRKQKTITDDDRRFWCFQPVRKTAPPHTVGTAPRSAVDAFIVARLRAEGIEPAGEADRRTLVRRIYFDLLGLPPSPDDTAAFVADDAPDACERLVDRLLADPRYGERWARHWLDLVRYAESDGFKQDDFRPHAWRYRDYVIRSFNGDKPYDRFVQEQIAGDEIAPHDPDAIVATGYLRHWIYEYNQRDVRSQWQNILNDVTDVTADVFLGLGLSCARCHDHKFDPILQKDYYRLQAFFAPLLPRDDLPLAAPDELAAYHARLADWEQKTAEIRREIDELERPHRERITSAAVDKFPKDIRPMLRKPATERLPFELQIAELAHRQVVLEQTNLKMETKLKDEPKEKWSALKKRLAEYDADKPQPLAVANAVTDVSGNSAPPTYIPGGRVKQAIEPGFLTILDPTDATIAPPPVASPSTGRRTALAQWLTSRDNPLPARVIVNRVWQFHFGRGLVRTSSDFGHLGEPPSHPELLDWLVTKFIDDGWQFKPLHRTLITSATYRQAALPAAPDAARTTDPDNRLLWRMNVRRLQAEQIRDAMLSTTGELDSAASGPSVDPAQPRRTIYTKVIRNTRDPLLDVFDAPDNFFSTAERNVTTTPNQALLLMNGPWLLVRAQALAARLQREAAADDGQLVTRAYQLAFDRSPTPDELATATSFLARQTSSADRTAALVDLCHVLLNSNEFVYVD